MTTSTTAAREATASTARRAVRLTLVVAFWLAVWQVVAWIVGHDFLLASPIAVAERLAELVHTWDFWSTVGLSL